MNANGAKPRIVLYGIGQYGQYIARFAQKKGWPVVAAYNRAGPKIGQDLGKVAGLGRDIGVIIEDADKADFGKLDADIGVVTLTNRLSVNMPAYQRLINAGLNVLCHGSEAYFPYGSDAGLAAEIDTLAKQKGVSFSGGGIWDMSRIWAGILVAGPSTELKALFHSSITDVAGQANAPSHMTQVGTGMTVGDFMAKGLDNSPIAGSYKTIPQHVLFALDYTLAETRARVEPVVFDIAVDIPILGLIPAGHCVGSRAVIDVDTREGVTAHTEIEIRAFRPGEVEHMFWSVDGKPRTRLRTERVDPAHTTAACLFNRIPDVIAAPPGIVLISQMGPLKHSALK